MLSPSHPRLALVLVGIGVSSACVKPHEVQEGASTDCVVGLDNCPATGSGDTSGSDETGGTSGPIMLEPGACVGNLNPNVTGYRHQCEGTVEFSLEFDIPFIAGAQNCDNMEALIDKPLCNESHVFGSEPYEQAQVASCCGPWDGVPEHESVYLHYCSVDLADQLCRTLVDRLEYHLGAKHFWGFEQQAQNIITEIANQIGPCAKQFLDHDINPDPAILDSHFALGNSESWPAFQDFTITVKIGDITGFGLPVEDTQWLECHGMQGNDADTLPLPQGDWVPDPHATILASAMTIALDGPLLLGSPVSGAAEMSSHMTSCTAPSCSHASFAVDAIAGEWAITQLELFAASNVTLANELGAYELTDVRIRLVDAPLGHVDGDARIGTIHVIDPGEAFFWVIGGEAGTFASNERFLVANATAIVATQQRGGWSVSAFELEYIDLDGEVWTLRIPESRWD